MTAPQGAAPGHDVTTISGDVVEGWRSQARRTWAGLMPEDAPHGWSVCPVDPGLVLPAFPRLSLRSGFRLAAYQYRAGRNGNTAVYAVADDHELPPVDDPTAAPPRPPDALVDELEAISGDDSAESYLQASMLARELEEFGALGHGTRWGFVHILGDDAWADEGEVSPSRTRPAHVAQRYRWTAKIPTELRPTVTVDGARAVVRFHTYSALDQEEIAVHVDVYAVGDYSMRSTTEVLATGAPGFKI